MMREPANDFHELTDPDDVEEAKNAAKTARIRQTTLRYWGRTDLLGLALPLFQELGDLQRRITASFKENGSKAERNELLAQITAKSDQLAAIEMAMDEETRAKLWEVMDEQATT